MPNFFFKVDPDLVPILQDQIRSISELLENELAIQVQLPDNDPELSLCWKYSLLEDLKTDCENLLFLLEDKFFGQQSIPLDFMFAESTLRACSAVRHKLRSTFLAELKDSEIESGDLSIAKLAPALQKPYACYAFLAYLQESIVQSLQLT